jgi:hypothetical protein
MASIQKRPDGRWRARCRDETGRELAKHFPRKVDAQRWLNEVTAAVVTGTCVDPNAGKITFRAYFEQWAARQVWTQGTHETARVSAECVTFADVAIARPATLTRSAVAKGDVTARSEAAGWAGTVDHPDPLQLRPHGAERGAGGPVDPVRPVRQGDPAEGSWG